MTVKCMLTIVAVVIVNCNGMAGIFIDSVSM